MCRDSIEQGTWGECELGDGSEVWHPDDLIQIQKCMNFDWRSDATKLFADKSMMGGLNTWASEFDSSYHREKYRTECSRPKGSINKFKHQGLLFSWAYEIVL